MQENEPFITVEHVGKKFCRSLKKSLWYGLQDIYTEVSGRQRSHDLRPDEFWALTDVSFELRRGECLGVIGPNGSGKSTLLKIINGLLRPDRGRIIVRGRTGALIELGTGFNPILTGRENIYNNAAVLGIHKADIDRKLDEIIDFAEIREFIDTPIQSYSSGMKVRLGFAVAAHLKPDVMLIDEVLAVGDVGFRAKCYLKISELIENCAVIFVSHNMSQIAKLCSKVLVLDRCRGISLSEPPQGIERYNSLFPDMQTVVAGTGEAKIEQLTLLDSHNRSTETFAYNEAMRIRFNLEVADCHEEYVISITFMNADSNLLAQCHSRYNNVTLTNTKKPGTVSVSIQNLPLNPGIYYINIIVFDKNNTKHLLWLYSAKKIIVTGDFHGGAPIQFSAAWEQTSQ